MAINKGLKKLEHIDLGTKKVVDIYKGSDHIFTDAERKYGFKMTIDTRLTQTGALTNTNKSFSFYVSADRRKYKQGYNTIVAKVYWGDGTSSDMQASNIYLSHTYSTAGEYQILIMPRLQGSKPYARGWLSGWNMNSSSGYDYKVKSIDTPFPEDSVFISFGAAPDEGEVWTYSGFQQLFRNCYNIESLPNNLFDKLSFSGANGTDAANLLSESFAGTGKNTSLSTSIDFFALTKGLLNKFDFSEITNFAGMFSATFKDQTTNSRPIPADLFSMISTSSGTNFAYMFSNTFLDYGSTANTNSIPTGLFDFLDTSNGTELRNMFQGTFYSCMRVSTAATIPLGIFSSLNTSNCTNFYCMFRETFANYGRASAINSIPSGLFNNVDTSNGTNFSQMFYQTFLSLGEDAATSGTIPSGLFDSIDTQNSTNCQQMFFGTFYHCLAKSTNGTIPAGLFDSIDTSLCTDFTGVFTFTFSQYAKNSTVATIPSGLFDSINTSSGVNFYEMFYGTFASYGSLSTVANIPSGLFNSINTQNGTNFYSMFKNTFSNYATQSTVGTIPSGLFDSIDTSSISLDSQQSYATGVSDMFSEVFSNYATQSTVGTIPSGLFDRIDTSNCKRMLHLFNGAFRSCFSKSNSATIPSGLFDSLDTRNAGTFSHMFNQTFSGYGKAYSIPAGLFDHIDMSGANTSIDNYPIASVFYQTFANAIGRVSGFSIPAGLFGKLNIPSTFSHPTSNNPAQDLFTRTFSSDNSSITETVVLTDIFDGMTDFGWVTEGDAYRVMYGTFYANASYRDNLLTGTSTTITQHFDFYPSGSPSMFHNQNRLTDYATIASGWK